MSADTPPEDAKRWIEALTWHETLIEADRSRLTTTLIRDWQAWHADPRNQRIFDHLSQLAADAGRSRQRRPPGEEEIAGDRYDPAMSVALWRKQGSSNTSESRPSRANRHRALMAAAAFVASAAILALVFWSPRSWMVRQGAGGSATFETAVGELKSVHLREGSEITLGGRTKLLVHLSSRARSVELIRGQAWFRVAHDARWPFIVNAGNGAITAVGTAFLVTRDPDRVVVTVTEGVISVRAPPLVNFIPARPIRVTRGEKLSYSDNGVIASVAKTDARAAIAWTQGRLIFDNEPLRYVIDDLNRYFARRILATSSAGKLHFSGVILHGQIEEWLRRLPEIVPVDVDERAADICIRLHTVETNRTCAAKD